LARLFDLRRPFTLVPHPRPKGERGEQLSRGQERDLPLPIRRMSVKRKNAKEEGKKLLSCFSRCPKKKAFPP